MEETITCFIVWETDGADISLPDKVEIPIDKMKEFSYNEDVTDYLSDKYGWLVKTFFFSIQVDLN